MAASVHRDWLARRATPGPASGLTDVREQEAVVACAVGCDVADVAPFVRSLRAVYAGQVILIVDRKPTLSAWLSTHGVETVVAADRLLHWKPHPALTRFAVCAQLLQERREVRDVIFSDVRDVVFQATPFRAPRDDLQFFTGAGGSLPTPSMTRIMEAMVGQVLARDLARRARIADVVLGSREAVVRYCRALLLLCSQPQATLGADVDRAAAHVIAHLGLASGHIRQNFQRVAIASCGMRVEDGRILNPDDSTSPIVVGYRRTPDLAQHVDQRWGLPSTRARPVSLRTAMRTIQASFLGGAAELR